MDLHQNLFFLRLPTWKTMDIKKKKKKEKIQKHISALKPSFYFHKSFQPLRSLTFAVLQKNLGLWEISHLLLKALGSPAPAFTDLSHSSVVKLTDKIWSLCLSSAANVHSHQHSTTLCQGNKSEEVLKISLSWRKLLELMSKSHQNL